MLVVDDHDDHRETAAQVLALSGYEVAAARDGAEALAVMGRGFEPDVVVVDLLMPRMDGTTFLQQARTRTPPPRAVVVTGLHSSALHKLLGADAVLFKPYELQQLLDAVGPPAVGS